MPNCPRPPRGRGYPKMQTAFMLCKKGKNRVGARKKRNQELDPESQVARRDRSAKKKTYAKMVIWIDWILLISSVIGVSLDPLFFQSPVIKEDKKCLSFDKRLYITAICVRSVTDLIYIANTILAISETSRKPIPENEISAMSTDANRPKAENTAAVLKAAWRKARMHWRRWNFLLVDILAVLPLPLVLITLIFSKEWEPKFLDERGLLNAALLFQYVPRILRIYLTWIKLIRTDDIFVMAVGIKAGFNFFLYIISSQVLGAFWYLFAVERELACWYVACSNHVGCIQSSFRCSSRSLGNYTFFNDYCPTITPNSTVYDFGIYTGALQSGIVISTNIPGKMVQCFWWGLRSLSSLGQNLQTSKDIWECCFAIFITILGLLLFLCFIGNMQTYMQLATETLEKITRKLKYKRLDIQLWLSNNGIKDKGMQEKIMCSIRDIIKRKEDFDEQRLLMHLPQEHKRDIKRRICKSLFEKVPTLGKASEDKYLWSLICDSLKPVYLNENSYIIRQGEVLDAMLFINQGTVCTFSTNDENGTGCLKQGDFYGEELVNWVLGWLTTSDPSNLPFSKMTLKCHIKVEAFSLWAGDLKNIVSGKDWRIKKFGQITGYTEAENELKHLAVKSLQAAFRRRKAEAKNSNEPRKDTKCAM